MINRLFHIMFIAVILMVLPCPGLAQEDRDKQPTNRQESVRKHIEQWGNAQRTDREAIFNAIIEETDVALPVLRETLVSGTQKEKILSMVILSETRDTEAVSYLIELTKDDDIKINTMAINSLRKIGDSAAAPRMREILALKKYHQGITICALGA